jgi:CheY-like chemotaxis protein
VGPARSLRVLVVDDDGGVRRWLAEAVRSLGHEVLEAGDGSAGLAALDGGPDVAVLDYAMPGMTGLELARALRERRPDLGVVLATGFAEFGPVPPGQRVLRKPFDLRELELALAEAAP